MKILLVEDNLDLLECTCMGLEYLGYEVTIAKDGEEAVQATVVEQPDLVVLDMLLPKMDGRQVAAKIRQNPRTQRIPILAAAGFSSSQDRSKALASGCDGYISKPFALAELENAIRSLIEKQAKPPETAVRGKRLMSPTLLPPDKIYGHATRTASEFSTLRR